MELDIPEKPCLVSTERGFSVSYKGRFLYSKYAPERAIEGAIEAMTILDGTLILAFSPALWLGLDLLLKKLGENCFVLGIECDKNLHEFARTELEKRIAENLSLKEKVALLPFEKNDYIVNLLSESTDTKNPLAQNGSTEAGDFFLPPLFTFRRAIPIEMSAGTQFFRSEYAHIASLAQNTIASFWKNRLTLTKLGRLYSRNLFHNLARLAQTEGAVTVSTIAQYREKISCPIFVFGAGESIEKTLATIPARLLEKCFVIAVDATSSALKAHKITPDAVVAVEGQLAIEKAYIGGTAKDAILFADMTSREQVTRHTNAEICYFASRYAPAQFFDRLSRTDFFPPVIPPLGSVGLTAIYLARLLRTNQNVPIFVNGLDFSFSLGRTHAKNTPAHIARLCACDRFHPIENYAAAFRQGAQIVIGKNQIPVVSDTSLLSYAHSFVDAFQNTPNLYDCGEQGIPLGIEEISAEKTSLYLETIEAKKGTNSSFRVSNANREIKRFLEAEETALNRIKELLMFGNDVASCSMSLDDELHALIAPREYLFLHFPDGYKCNTRDLSFLKRVRGQIDFFLKDIRLGQKATCLASSPFPCYSVPMDAKQQAKRQKILAKIQEFTLMDDDFMTRFFADDKERTEFLLRTILGRDDLTVTEVTAQKVIDNLHGRSVRLDVFARDSKQNPYDIEIQRTDKGAGARRARYNSALMDADETMPNMDLDLLPESYVIFITENDIYQQGKPLYKIERYIDGKTPFNDGAHIVYVNGQYRGNDKIGDLMHDFSCKKSADMKNAILAEKVRQLKENEQGVTNMCRIMEEFAREEREEGKAERDIETAAKLLEQGDMSEARIKEFFNFSDEQMKLVKEQISVLA